MDLVELIKRECLSFGDFTLSSGAKSTFYLDLRKVTLSHHVAAVAARLCCRSPSHNRGQKIYEAIGGPESAANQIVGACLFRESTLGYATRGFVVRKAPKDHGLKDLVVGSAQPGDRCLLVEDVATSGASLRRAALVMQEFGCKVVGALAIVDREAGAFKALEDLGIPFRALVTLEQLGVTP